MPANEHEHADQHPAREGRGLTPFPKASDADRNAALERLRDAFADGRLTDDELDQRTRAALTARTVGDLEWLLVDLPTASTTPTTPARPGRPVRLTLGVLGDTERRWRWTVAPRSAAVALLGACRLDLRGAKLSAPVTTITAVAVAGGIDVVVGCRPGLLPFRLASSAGESGPAGC
jgi:hypothetical protein